MEILPESLRAFLKSEKKHYVLGLVALLGVDCINVALPFLIQMGIDRSLAKQYSGVVIAAVAYLGLMILQSFGRYLWRVHLIGTSHTVARKIRTRLFEHLESVPTEHRQAKSGALLSLATNDLEAVRTALGPGVLVTADAIILIALIVPAALYLDVGLGLGCIALFLAVPMLNRVLGRRIDTYFDALQAALSEISAFGQQTLSAIRWIKASVFEPEVERRMHALSDAYQLRGAKLAKYEATLAPLLGLFTQLAIILVLCVGGLRTARGTMTLGTFIAFQRLVLQLLWPMQAIGYAFSLFREGRTGWRRIETAMALPSAVLRRPSRRPRVDAGAVLNLRDVEIAFPGGAHLRVPAAELRRGQKIGLVGAIGSGKTALLERILRLREPGDGSIYLAGHDVVTLGLDGLRRRVALVEQAPTLFSETIAQNLNLGRPRGADAPRAEMLRTLDTVGIRAEVEALTEGLDTIVGERGITLSGGQRQRLAIGRALLRSPELLLLDDCFSAIDLQIEERILDALLADRDLSFVFATHRLNPLPRLDAIWVIGPDGVLTPGSHAELLAGHSFYRELWHSQRPGAVA